MIQSVLRMMVWMVAAVALHMGTASYAQTALRIGSDTLFESNSAKLTKDGQKFLDDYFSRQKCELFEIIGYSKDNTTDPIVARRMRVIASMVKRYEGESEFVNRREEAANIQLASAGDETFLRRVEIFPQNCAALAANAGSAGGAGLPAGIVAIVILGVVGAAGGGGGTTSAPHTN